MPLATGDNYQDKKRTFVIKNSWKSWCEHQGQPKNAAESRARAFSENEFNQHRRSLQRQVQITTALPKIKEWSQFASKSHDCRRETKACVFIFIKKDGTQNSSIKKSMKIRFMTQKTSKGMLNWDWGLFTTQKWKKVRVTRLLACCSALIIILDLRMTTKEIRPAPKSSSIKPRFYSPFQALQSPVKLLRHIIKRIILRKSHTNQKTNNSCTETRLMRSGEWTIQTRKGTMGLSLSFQSTLRRARKQSPIHHTKMYGSQTSMERVRILLRLWPNHAHQRVSCCSMRSEGTSEMISRSMICYFVVIIVLKGDFAKSTYKGYYE